MLNFTYCAPTKIVFGHDAELQAGALCREFGAKKVLLHYGSDRVLKNGLMDRVKLSLDQAGVSYVMLGGVVPNPRIELAREGVKLCVNENVDLILAVGGGSVIDSSKAIGYGVASGGDPWDFYSGKRRPTGCLPIGCVLTIAAAGSEMSNSSVLTNAAEGLKHGTNTEFCRCRFAMMNPELTETLPAYQTACGCADIMMHTMERYFTNSGTMEMTDGIAEALLNTVKRNALILVKDPANYDARGEVMWAGSLSHNGLTQLGSDGGDWCVHQLEHELGAMFDVAHGAGLCAVWPSWARYVYLNCLDRFVRFAVNVMGVQPGRSGEETALLGIEAVESFYHEIGMPTTLTELGIDPSDEQIALMAKRVADWNGGKKGTAKVLYEQDFVNIYHNAK